MNDRQIRTISRACGALTVLIAATVLAGWWFGLDGLTTFFPRWSPMSPVSAAGLGMAGLALWTAPGSGLAVTGTSYQASLVLSALVALLGVAVLGGHLAGTGAHGLLSSRALEELESLMPVVTALGLAFLGLACILIHLRRVVAGQAILLALIAAFAIPFVSDLYPGTAIGQIAPFRAVPGHTEAAVLLLAIGTVVLQARQGVTAVVFDPGVGGRILRRLFPLMVVVLVTVGGLRIWGEQLGWYGTGTGTALMVVVGAGLLATCLFIEARQLIRLESERDTFFTLGEDLFCIADFGGRFLRLNPAFSKTLGWSDADLMDRPFLDFVHPDDREATVAEMARLSDGATTLNFRNRYRCRDGSWRWLSWTAAPVVAEGLIYASARDVTALRAAEESLRASEENLAVTLASIGDGVIATDTRGCITRLNHQAERLTGWPADEAVGQPIQAVFRIEHEATGAPVEIPVEAVFRLGTIQGLANRTVLIARDGTARPIADSAAPIRDRQGVLIGAVLVFRDVTAERESERALEQLTAELEDRVRERTAALTRSERRLSEFLERAPDALVLFDREGKVQYVNGRTLALFGASAEALLGASVDVLLAPEEGRGRTILQEVVVAGPGPAAGPSLHSDLRAARRDGTEFAIDLSLVPIDFEEETLIAASIRDETERHQMEAQLHQSRKLEAIGQLAGGVAHDFNNLLTVILGYGELLAAQLPPSGPQREALQQIEAAGKRATDLTQQLLAFSRRQVLEPEVVDLNEAVQEVSGMLRRVIGEDIRFQITLREVPPIRIDPGQLHQVMFNLALNARDAMPGGGQLTFETMSVKVDSHYAGMHPGIEQGDWVVLLVSDTGVGMDAQTRRQAFDPFFTTKEVGRGTGLGLSTVQGIVSQSGGHIWLYSEEGLGTTFKLHFPIEKTGSGPAEREPIVESLPGGTETVLLVEDERAVRVVTRLTLEGLGYRVLEAATGEEAIRIAEERLGEIDLLLTDVVMPGMGGRQVAERIGELLPSIKVIYMSGYPQDTTVRAGIEGAQVAFVQKPFTTRTIATRIRQAVDS